MSDPINCPSGMVYIPTGYFERGSQEGKKDERPVRQIYVSGFCADRHGVTNEAWEKYNPSSRSCQNKIQTQKKPLLNESSNQSVCTVENFLSPRLPSPKGFDRPKQPVVKVSWNDANSYCQANGKRLPTEAEREKMAKGPSGKDKYGTQTGRLTDDRENKLAHYSERSTADVCSYPPNGYNLCDPSGNTWEWTSDWYSESYYQNSPDKDPKGPERGDYKVLRGGAWHFYHSENLRSSQRNFNDVGLRTLAVGFRCVADVKN